jgi:hypothetical protein
MPGGHRPRLVGYYHEKKLEGVLAPYGFRRMVMSGALGGDHAGDLRRPSSAPGSLRVLESKYRKSGQRTLRRWLTQATAQALVLPGDGRREGPLVVLPLELLCQLLEEAGYRQDGPEKGPPVPAEP